MTPAAAADDARRDDPARAPTRSDGTTFVENFLKGERALLARVQELADERWRRGSPFRSAAGKSRAAR
jgi:hypothetical protein